MEVAKESGGIMLAAGGQCLPVVTWSGFPVHCHHKIVSDDVPASFGLGGVSLNN